MSHNQCNLCVESTEHAPAGAAGFRPTWWRSALDGLALPAMRLHRYRIAQNRVLLDALCDLDCRSQRNDSP